MVGVVRRRSNVNGSMPTELELDQGEMALDDSVSNLVEQSLIKLFFNFQMNFAIANISLKIGDSLVLSKGIIRESTSQGKELKLKIVSQPKAGWIIRDMWDLNNITSIDQFTTKELDDHRIFYVSNPLSNLERDSFSLVACPDAQQCSHPKRIYAAIKKRNVHGNNSIFVVPL